MDFFMFYTNKNHEIRLQIRKKHRKIAKFVGINGEKSRKYQRATSIAAGRALNFLSYEPVRLFLTAQHAEDSACKRFHLIGSGNY